jgi:hypothetical protein
MLLRLLCLVSMLTIMTSVARADGPTQFLEPQYQACITHSCQLVPDVKPIKKIVYEVREEPYCVKKLPPLLGLLHHRCGDCGQCDECQCVRYRKVLVKKEIVCGEICTTKCVVQEHVEHVPCQPPCK